MKREQEKDKEEKTENEDENKMPTTNEAMLLLVFTVWTRVKNWFVFAVYLFKNASAIIYQRDKEQLADICQEKRKPMTNKEIHQAMSDKKTDEKKTEDERPFWKQPFKIALVGSFVLLCIFFVYLVNIYDSGSGNSGKIKGYNKEFREVLNKATPENADVLLDPHRSKITLNFYHVKTKEEEIANEKPPGESAIDDANKIMSDGNTNDRHPIKSYIVNASSEKIESLSYELERRGIAFNYADPPKNRSSLIYLVLFGVVIGVILFNRKRSAMGGAQAQGANNEMTKSGASILTKEKVDVTFKDVAGIDNAKARLQIFVKFLKRPKIFRYFGAKCPKGALLEGPPGTGKTMLAKALAVEAGVPFFSLSGSQFVEMYVGVGAARVRDLFKEADKNAPCIIFIDEIDALAQTRGMSPGNNERDITVNELLVKLDGFDHRKGVTFIGATNRKDILDPGLLRPGRIDRQIYVGLTTEKGRKKIFDVHLRKAAELAERPIDELFASSVKSEKLAKSTTGFSGADIENMVNEACLIVAERNDQSDFLDDKISILDFEEAKQTIILGMENNDLVRSDEVKKIVSYHEVGHALAAAMLPETDLVNMISILPREKSSGVTEYIPREGAIRSKTAYLNKMAGLAGGRIAEIVEFDIITAGAENDIKVITAIATEMVVRAGMSEDESLRFINLSQDSESVIGGGGRTKPYNFGEEINRMVFKEVKELINKSAEISRNVIENNKDILEKVSETLLEKEILTGDEFYQIIRDLRPGKTFPFDKKN